MQFSDSGQWEGQVLRKIEQARCFASHTANSKIFRTMQYLLVTDSGMKPHMFTYGHSRDDNAQSLPSTAAQRNTNV